MNMWIVYIPKSSVIQEYYKKRQNSQMVLWVWQGKGSYKEGDLIGPNMTVKFLHKTLTKPHYLPWQSQQGFSPWLKNWCYPVNPRLYRALSSTKNAQNEETSARIYQPWSSTFLGCEGKFSCPRARTCFFLE